MYAVVVRESGDAALIETSAEMVQSTVVPAVKQAPGFVSGLWMTDGSGGTLNILVFDSEGAARAALELVRNAPRPPFMKVESVDLMGVRASA